MTVTYVLPLEQQRWSIFWQLSAGWNALSGSPLVRRCSTGRAAENLLQYAFLDHPRC
jgi:hypothetical protein